jgi:hypothetical protein
MFDDEAHVLQMADACLGMAKPETLRVASDQRGRALDQVRWRRGGRRHFAQCIGHSSHAATLRSVGRERKGLFGAQASLQARHVVLVRP